MIHSGFVWWAQTTANSRKQRSPKIIFDFGIPNLNIFLGSIYNIKKLFSRFWRWLYLVSEVNSSNNETKLRTYQVKVHLCNITLGRCTRRWENLQVTDTNSWVGILLRPWPHRKLFACAQCWHGPQPKTHCATSCHKASFTWNFHHEHCNFLSWYWNSPSFDSG